ncbi:hypothetical protein HAX54_050235 [Datura stramonium]|uniref:Uncharacterized protein n=1 Tax=Datura stramonium TaxID=4076 RepID=A0ABS8SWH2_DATST|nr:hypothetical protein [Datura stramonium]
MRKGILLLERLLGLLHQLTTAKRQSVLDITESPNSGGSNRACGFDDTPVLIQATKQQPDTNAKSNVNTNTNGAQFLVENVVQQTGQQLVMDEVQNNASKEFLERILE